MRSRRSWVVSTLGPLVLVIVSLVALRPQAAVIGQHRGVAQGASSNACAACMATARENNQLKTQVATLTAEVKTLRGQLNTCNRELIDSHGG